MEAGAECDRIQEELVIIQKEMKALILHCGRCMEQTQQEQLRYCMLYFEIQHECLCLYFIE